MKNWEYVQYGCGWCAPATWLNFDCSPTLRLERLPVLGRFCQRNAQRFPSNVHYGDIVKGLPIPRNVSRGIYCSHILEHLSLEDARIALRNTCEHLRPGGVFRLVIPDLEQLARGYLSNNESDAAIRFMESSCLGKKDRVRSIAGMLSEWIGNSAHLWMWDEKAMKQELSRQGFVKIRRAAFGDCDDRRFDDVEQPDRFVSALAVQCEKGL
jgi:hypothetical protein